MRYLKSFLILAAVSVLAFSCKKDEPTVVTKPEAPVIENVTFTLCLSKTSMIRGKSSAPHAASKLSATFFSVVSTQ